MKVMDKYDKAILRLKGLSELEGMGDVWIDKKDKEAIDIAIKAIKKMKKRGK